MDLKLTTDGDLDFSTGDLILLEHPDDIAQHLRIRLRFFLGEWFLDQRIGIPYFEKILIKNPNEAVIRSIYRDVILTTPGVEALRSLELSYDEILRKLTVEFDAQIVGADQPLSFVEELIL